MLDTVLLKSGASVIFGPFPPNLSSLLSNLLSLIYRQALRASHTPFEASASTECYRGGIFPISRKDRVFTIACGDTYDKLRKLIEIARSFA